MQNMKRRITQKLRAWKESAHRKPLVILGARQVGKTYAIKRFAEEAYGSLLYVDFSRDADVAGIFESSIDPSSIVASLELYYQCNVDPAQTLIVFDEVQLCERALTSLKYFCDDAPQYSVVAAGSLLGVKVNREKYSFPVGKVDLLYMHPMSFEEYLWARGNDAFADAIRDAADHPERPFALHDKAMGLVREYELVGGMPEVVSVYMDAGAAGNSALEAAQRKQAELNVAYAADMIKYADEVDSPRILAAWNSLPRQLAKENHKFQYKEIRSGARASQYQAALEWLDASGIAERCTRVSDGVAPLRMFEDPSAFKLYGADTGLLAARYEARPVDLKPSDDKASIFRGSLAENYVFQQLRASDASIYYWGTSSRYEVEFVARLKHGGVVPIEVKSGRNVSAASLRFFTEKYKPEASYRISSKNFGVEGTVTSVPLYAAWVLGEKLE